MTRLHAHPPCWSRSRVGRAGTRGRAMKLVFVESADMFGRIVVYLLDVFGHLCVSMRAHVRILYQHVTMRVHGLGCRTRVHGSWIQ